MADGVKVNNCADHKNPHGSVKETEWIVRMIKKENVGNPQNQSGNGERHHGDQM